MHRILECQLSVRVRCPFVGAASVLQCRQLQHGVRVQLGVAEVAHEQLEIVCRLRRVFVGHAHLSSAVQRLIRKLELRMALRHALEALRRGTRTTATFLDAGSAVHCTWDEHRQLRR